MATHKSSEKRARQDRKIAAHKSAYLSSVKTAEKRVLSAITSKDSNVAQESLKKFMSSISKAAQKGIVTPQRASRKISKISQQVSTLK